MKRIFICLSVFMLCFVIGKQDQKNSKSTTSQPKKYTIKSEIFFRKALTLQKIPKINEEDPIESILKNQSGSLLYQYLFEGPFKTSEGLTIKSFQYIQERFKQELPLNRAPHDQFAEKEMASRIAILKALQNRRWSKADSKERSIAINFFEALLDSPDEHWLIKRQAFRSLLSLQPTLTENQRSERLRGLESRVIASAAISDQETIEMMLEK